MLLKNSASRKIRLETFVVIRKQQGLVYSNMCWLLIGRPRLCFTANEILPLLNYHENFRTYFAHSTILHVALFYRPHFTMISLLYDLFLKRKKCFVALQFVFGKENHFRCCMICLGKEKLFLLLNFSETHKNCFVAV